jgi:hypothetical protein
MPKTRPELDAALDQLQADLPAMIEQNDEASIMDAFANAMEAIESATAPADTEHLFSRTQCMLRDAGLIPADDEPCSE